MTSASATPTAPARPATTTKLTGLTRHNVAALTGLTGWTVSKTTAIYNGTPTAALDSVQHRMDQVRSKEGGRATGYQSLIAVRNKLREPSTGTSHPAVTVTIKKATKKKPTTLTGSPKARLTRKRQEDFTAAQLVGALEDAWSVIRTKHPEVPQAVIVVGSGTATRQAKHGHYAPTRWQHGDNQLAEVLISGEGLKRPVPEVLTTLLHEAARGLANTREIKDTSRQGRWHNEKFATHAKELGLEPTKDPKFGWSACTLRDETTKAYSHVITDLTKALKAYRHPEVLGSGKEKNSNNAVACACQCPRRIRVAKSVLEEGSITCDVCETQFEPDE
ncbi:hypothetical protein [Kribbella sancticallisti]